MACTGWPSVEKVRESRTWAEASVEAASAAARSRRAHEPTYRRASTLSAGKLQVFCVSPLHRLQTHSFHCEKHELVFEVEGEEKAVAVRGDGDVAREGAGVDGLKKFEFVGIGDVHDSGVARSDGELVGVGDEQLAVVIEECEADGREAVAGDGAEEGVAGVVLEGGGVEDKDVVVVTRGDVEGAAIGGYGHADGTAAGVEEAECVVALMLRAVVGGRRGGLDGGDDEEAA